jgi:hypothetical protein
VKPFPRQLHRQGAEDGWVLVWSEANQQWEPASLGDLGATEILTQDGVSPLVFLTNEAEDEFLYADK